MTITATIGPGRTIASQRRRQSQSLQSHPRQCPRPKLMLADIVRPLASSQNGSHRMGRPLFAQRGILAAELTATLAPHGVWWSTKMVEETWAMPTRHTRPRQALSIVATSHAEGAGIFHLADFGIPTQHPRAS